MKKLVYYLLTFTVSTTFLWAGFRLEDEEALFSLWDEEVPISDLTLPRREEALCFVPPESPILKEVTEDLHPSEITHPKTAVLVEKMLNLAYGSSENRETPLYYGIAAPQLGINKSIILVDTTIHSPTDQKTSLKIFFNPKIVWQSSNYTEWTESCYSTGCICGIVPRSQSILVSAWNEKGEKILEEYEGYVARIFQHAIDHLNGERFPERINNPKHLHWVEEKDFLSYQKNWKSWEKVCPPERWSYIKKYGCYHQS